MGKKGLSAYIDKIHGTILSEKARDKSEKIIVYISVLSFLIHLAIIYSNDAGLIALDKENRLLTSPIAAIYTPFSFILIFEVYLLVYYLPKSITTYIGKQYEIITLIIIRRIFKDISSMEMTVDWFSVQDNRELTYDLLAAAFLYFLLYLFYRQAKMVGQSTEDTDETRPEVSRFIRLKKAISVILVPVLVLLAIYTFTHWTLSNLSVKTVVVRVKDINDIFFDEFFTLLILVDVVLLLFTFIMTNKFFKIIRNSGFVISTVLIRLSFGTERVLNTSFIIAALLFGVIIMIISNQFEKQELDV